MHSSGAFLNSVLERARSLIEEPVVESQYNDSFLARQVIPPEYAIVLGALSLGMDNPIVMRLTVTITSGTAYWRLPPCVRQVWRLALVPVSGSPNLIKDFWPRGEDHPFGPGWRIEGREIVFDPPVTSDQTWSVWFVPSADVIPHVGTGTIQASGSEVVLSAAPSLGILDRRDQAYMGCTIRVLGTTTHEERVIQEYNPTTRVATLRSALTANTSGTATYEVAPLGWAALWDAVAIRTAIRLGAMRNASEKKLAVLEGLYNRALKAARDQLGNMQGRRTKGFERRSMDHPDYVEYPTTSMED